MAKDNSFIIGLRERYKKMTELCEQTSQRACEQRSKEQEGTFQDVDLLAELEKKFDELFGPLGEDEISDKHTANQAEDDTA